MKRILPIIILFFAAYSLPAQNSCGTVTDYDGNTYSTVQIGKQCWMKENLRTKHYANGESIPFGGSSESGSSPFYYDYSSSGIPLSERGYLYNWPAAMHGASSSNTNPSYVQGVCPNGWHLPSDAEWTQLTDYVGSRSEYVCGGDAENIAKALASTTHWSYSSETCAPGNNQRYNNSTGFSAVPAGHYGWNSGTSGNGTTTDFWSSSQYEHETYSAYDRTLGYSIAFVGRDDIDKSYGYSVRCLCDKQNENKITPDMLFDDFPADTKKTSDQPQNSNENEQGNSQDSDSDEPIQLYAQEPPEFPGGMDAVQAFLRSEVQYPEVARNNGITGTVLVEFVVEKDGRVTNAKVKVPLFPECDKEAVRAVLAMPRWKPAKNAGVPVRCFYQVPVRFTM